VTATHAERAATLKHCKPYVLCWLLLISDLALRAQTALSIAPQHYNRESQTITFATKFGTWQTLPVTAQLQKLFAAVAPGADPLMPYVVLLHPRHKVSLCTLRQCFYRAMSKAGITRRITPHDMRRTTAKEVYENSGKDLRLVQAVLGHKQLASTLHYLDHRNTPVPLAALELAKLNPITERKQ